MKKIICSIFIFLFSFSFSSCSNNDSNNNNSNNENNINENNKGENNMNNIKMTVNDYTFVVILENTKAASELYEIVKTNPLTLELSDYSGFEKVGELGRSLTTNDRQTTTSPGDIVLYNGDNIVVFYGSNSWSYTRLGHIEDISNLRNALGNDDVVITFTLG